MENRNNWHISCHEIQDKTVWQNLYEGRRRFWKLKTGDIHQFPVALSSFSGIATELSIDAIIEGKAKDAMDYLRLSHLSRLWHWHGMTGDGPHLVCLPGIADFEAGRMRPNVDVNVPSVLKGIEIAIILRDYPAGCIYRQVNFDAISNFGGVQMATWSANELRAMQQVGVDDARASELFMLAESSLLELISQKPESSELEPLFAPLFRAWAALLGPRDPETFNAEIRSHLVNWKADYSSTKDGSSVVNGFVSFHALAACAYAHDLGMEITVSSDYIPEFLIRGGFPRVKWPNPEWITA